MITPVKAEVGRAMNHYMRATLDMIYDYDSTLSTVGIFMGECYQLTYIILVPNIQHAS